MAFGGGFGGFGSASGTQQSSTFGGFGSSGTGGFGQPQQQQPQQQQQQQQGSGFGGTGAGTGGGGLFGGGGGGGGSTFGSGTSAFGAPKAFGTTTSAPGGGLFGGGGTATAGSTGFGGFGSTTGTSSGFGGGSTGGTLFGGGNKTGFGNTPSTGGGLFGNANTGGGFGTTSTGGNVFGNTQNANNQECSGTATQPFQAFTEKETNSTATNHYQSITFMQPYQKWSFEELRLADYNAGRRYGNGSTQPAGGFGTSTFGGFGQNTQATTSGFGGGTATGGGLFGSGAQQSSSGGFGSTTQTAGGFGGTGGGGGGGLFGGGQNKPAGGLFGSGTATSTTGGGGLFGGTGSTGFGTQQTSGFGGGSGSTLFGSNNQTQKPGGLFGGGTQQTSAPGGSGFGTGFGPTSGTTGGLFGNNQPAQQQTGSLFGGTQQQSSGGLFGGQNQSQNTGGGFGGFGQANQQKPSGGLFGNTGTSTGGGLFGQPQNQQQQQQSGTGLFNQPAAGNTGGLFGQKPAQTGSSLFGGQQGSNTLGGGLFGNTTQNQPQQSQGGGLFGGLNNNSGGGMFGQKPAQTGTSLFGNTQQPAQSNSLFGGQGNQTQGASLFGSNNNASNSMGAQQNALQGPPALMASAQDANPYGSASIFSGLPPPPQQSPGPIATPITAGQKQKKPAALPQFKINPAMASRFSTPQKRGYGFTYSSYGTPSSVSSAASTPGGMSSSLLANSLGRNLSKSFSTSNLRRTFDSDGESILSPGAFSANSNRYGTGSLKKLNIDRSLRTDLFGNHAVAALPAPERNEPSRSPAIKKKVSFDASTLGGTGADSPTNGVAGDDNESSVPEPSLGRTRANGATNGNRNGNGGSPSKEASANSELTTVHEDGSPQSSNSNALVVLDQVDPELGSYWTKPSLAELKKLPREKLKAVAQFEVGRHHGGYVRFEEPVDLTTVDLDNICGTVVVIEMRSLTVYPTNVTKPPMGRGLNVPSTITLENSWPRQRDKKTPSFEKSGPRFDKHVKRLSMVSDTEFVAYSADTGEWTFRVPHFTTYGLDYDDETTEHSDADGLDHSVSGEDRGLEDQFSTNPRSDEAEGTMDLDDTTGDFQPDDTFDFMKRPLPPGAFDQPIRFEDDWDANETEERNPSFLGARSATLLSNDEDSEQDEPSEPQAEQTQDLVLTADPEISHDAVEDLIGAFPSIDGAPSGVFGIRMLDDGYGLGTPPKTLVNQDMNWVEQLQCTVSPRKQDRNALRQSQALFLTDYGELKAAKPQLTAPPAGNDFATSIDLMHSLFGREDARRSTQVWHDGENADLTKSSHQSSDMAPQTGLQDTENAFHASFKPSWSRGHRLTYIANDTPDSMARDVCTMRFERSKDITAANFQQQREQSECVLKHGIPKAKIKPLSLEASRDFANETAPDSHEALIWELASVLLGEHEDDISAAVPAQLHSHFEARMRKDRLAVFWARVCEAEAMDAVSSAQSAEERAIAYLSAHKVTEACTALADGKNYRLATLVAQIGGDETFRTDMVAQLDDWRDQNVLSEISDPIRAIYELLSGNTCTAQGKSGAVEDRARTFLIPERFNMGWKRAFGLKLWYGVLDEQSLEEAVQMHLEELTDTGLRSPRPPFLVDETVSLPWEDPHSARREDVMWGLLKLYSRRASESDPTLDLALVVMPENSVGLPMFHRLPFDLYRVLAPQFPNHSNANLGDALTVAFATELEAANQWIWAVFASLHLSDAQCRHKAVQSILARNGDVLQTHSAKAWSLLVDEFRIPEGWLWGARALFARSCPDISPEIEMQYLQKAQDTDEAHRKLLETVAPMKIVERDYRGLEALLQDFQSPQPASWERGGGLYAQFIDLLKRKESNEPSKSQLLQLIRGLTSAEDVQLFPGSTSEMPNDRFLRKVALRDMSQIVGDMLVSDNNGETSEQSSVLQLPLNPETKAQKARQLSWGYYQRMMAQSH